MSLMPQTPFQWFIPATTGTGMVPAAGYLVNYYAAGTTDPKTIYTDPLLSVPYPSPGNVAVLDAEGRALIYLGAGGYKMVITDPSGNPVYEQDNIAGESSFGTGFVDSFAALADVDTTLNKYTYIGGYYAPGDGGEGMFYNQTSSDTSDGGYIQDSTFDNTKKWFRIPDENGDVRVASFGYCGSGTLTSNLMGADYYAYNKGFRLRIKKSLALYTASVTLNSPYVIFDSNAKLQGATGSQSILINSIVIAEGWKLFDNFTAGISLNNSKQESRPEWFGAVSGADGGDPGVNATAFADWVSAGAGLFIVPPGSWPHTSTFSPSSTATTVFNGEILSGSGPSVAIHIGVYYPMDSRFDLRADSVLNVGAGNSGLGEFTVNDGYDDANHIGSTISGSGIKTWGTFLAGGSIRSETAISTPGEITGGILNSDNTVNAVTSVNAGTIVTANGNISSGSSGEGHLIARVGTGALTLRAAGAGQVIVGTGDAALPSNSVIGLYQYVKIICAGTTTSTNPTFTVTVGGLTVFSCATLRANPGTYNYHIEVLVFRTGPTTSYSTGTVSFNAGSATSTDLIITAGTDSRTAAITWSGSNAISHSASATNVKGLTMFEVYPYDGT